MLDGSSRQTLVSTGFLSLSSLAIDLEDHRVFWADDGRRRIESVEYSGSSRRSVVDVDLHDPVAVAVLGRYVYWADVGLSTVERADKVSGSERVVLLRRRAAQLTDTAAVVRRDDRCFNACGRLRCSHLCVLDAAAAARCSCPLGMALDAADSVTCRRPVPRDCEADEVRCAGGGACVPRCDGVGDCPDAVDELGCYGSCSSESQFQCLSGTIRCVAASLRCNGQPDCDDASDEARCVRCVGPDAVMCRSDARCISRRSVCDGRRHCSDGQDELHCSPSASPALIALGSVCILLLVVVVAVTGVVLRRRLVARGQKPPSGPPLPTVSSKSGSVGLHAIIAARGGSSLRCYDRCPPGSASTMSSGCTSVSSVVPLHRCYPLNPPPSLCTSAYSTSRDRVCLMTPCSTDVCDDDDMDSAAALNSRSETEPMYWPPPPTPYSRCDDETASDYRDDDDDATVTSYDCERHQHSVTRATSPVSCVS